MKLFLLFLFFISTTYAELEWKNSNGNGCSTYFDRQTHNNNGEQFYYTLSDDCNLYNPANFWFDYVYINDIYN